MSQFLKKIAVFILVLVGYTTFVFIVNTLIFEFKKVPLKNSSLLIAGDSHLQKALNPTLFYSAQNISQTAEPYVVTFWKLQYLFNKIKTDTLLLSFSHHNISGYNDNKFTDKFWSSEMFRRTYQIQKLHEVEKLGVDRDEFRKVYFRNMCLVPKWNPFTFIGAYENKPVTNISDFQEAINRHYYKNEKETGVSQAALAYLDSIVQLCSKKHIALILIGSPVHPTYFDRIPDDIKKSYNEAKERQLSKNIMVLDYTDHFYETRYYYNSDHLNSDGATRFSSTIINLINNPANERVEPTPAP